MPNQVTEDDLDEKLDVKRFKQFLRDLRDLAQAADRRISSRRIAVMGSAWILWEDGSRESVPNGMLHRTYMLNKHEDLADGDTYAEVRLYDWPNGSEYNCGIESPDTKRWLKLVQADVLASNAVTVSIAFSNGASVSGVPREDFLTAKSVGALKRAGRVGSIRVAAIADDDLHDLATVAAYLTARGTDENELIAQLKQRHPGLTGEDVTKIRRYAMRFYGRRMPNLETQKASDDYNEKHGLPKRQHLSYAAVDPKVAEQIARDYEALPTTPPDETTPEGKKSKAAYDALTREVRQQFDHLPITIERWTREGQPYANSREMAEDVADNHHMFVFYGGDDHPYLSRDDNFKFRAIHDYYGHTANGFEFGPRGEENAWLAHRQMFTPEAIPAMTAETRAQNSAVNFGGNKEHNRTNPKETMYATQKAHVLPEHHNVRHVEPFRFSSRRAMIARLL